MAGGRIVSPIAAERTALLRRAIERSQGARTFNDWAREELLRDPRTINYWLKEQFPIPEIVMPRLRKLASRRIRSGQREPVRKELESPDAFSFRQERVDRRR